MALRRKRGKSNRKRIREKYYVRKLQNRHKTCKKRGIYKIESDTLVDSDGDILLFGGVNVKIFENNLVTNNIYSNNAIVFNKSDSMSANGNVKIISSKNGYILYTDTIMLYNQTNLVRANNEVLFINDEDSLKGIGFWSDFDMENWRIEKPIASIIKGD